MLVKKARDALELKKVEILKLQTELAFEKQKNLQLLKGGVLG